MDDQCSFDSLKIFDGADENSSKSWTFCGEETPPDVTSSGTYLFAVFSSDDKLEKSGFEAHLKMVQVDTLGTFGKRSWKVR